MSKFEVVLPTSEPDEASVGLAKIGDAWPGAYSLSTTEQLDEVPTVPQIDAAMAIVRALRTALGIQ